MVLAVLGTGGCRRSDCDVPGDVTGAWSGPGRDQRGGRFTALLELAQSGDTITGSYAVSGAAPLPVYGLRIGRRVEFDVEPLAACARPLRGVARFCGESLDLTLDGQDCDGPYHATATLNRTSRVVPVAGAAGGGQGGAGRVGRSGTGVPRAGAGGTDRPPQPTPPCAYLENGRCDEPEGSGLCPEGTDVADCRSTMRPCAYQNDGSCDEPEGTGLCGEGQDTADCRPAEICGSFVCKVPGPVDDMLGSVVRPCCIDRTRCGLAIGDGSCFTVTSGERDEACTQALAPYLPMYPIAGCCRTDGLCGLAADAVDFGCVLPESANLTPPGTGRIACGGSDDIDAGAP